jgi:hypothetical protein
MAKEAASPNLGDRRNFLAAVAAGTAASMVTAQTASAAAKPPATPHRVRSAVQPSAATAAAETTPPALTAEHRWPRGESENFTIADRCKKPLG